MHSHTQGDIRTVHSVSNIIHQASTVNELPPPSKLHLHTDTMAFSSEELYSGQAINGYIRTPICFMSKTEVLWIEEVYTKASFPSHNSTWREFLCIHKRVQEFMSIALQQLPLMNCVPIQIACALHMLSVLINMHYDAHVELFFFQQICWNYK